MANCATVRSFCGSHQQQYSFNLQVKACERIPHASNVRLCRSLQSGDDCRFVIPCGQYGIRSLPEMAALPTTAENDRHASRRRRSTKGKLTPHTTVKIKSNSIMELLFCYIRWSCMRHTPYSYPICSVKVTRRSVLHVRRSEPPCSCMILRERLSPMPEPSGLVV